MFRTPYTNELDNDLTLIYVYLYDCRITYQGIASVAIGTDCVHVHLIHPLLKTTSTRTLLMRCFTTNELFSHLYIIWNIHSCVQSGSGEFTHSDYEFLFSIYGLLHYIIHFIDGLINVIIDIWWCHC